MPQPRLRAQCSWLEVEQSLCEAALAFGEASHPGGIDRKEHRVWCPQTDKTSCKLMNLLQVVLVDGVQTPRPCD